jgi:hypothetical protein
MKVTTVRFSDDLWDAIAREAALSGVSASQFIREAALARAAAAAGARGELPFDSLAAAARAVEDVAAVQSADPAEIQAALSMLARAIAGNVRSDARALRAESEQTKRHSEQISSRSRPRRST